MTAKIYLGIFLIILYERALVPAKSWLGTQVFRVYVFVYFLHKKKCRLTVKIAYSSFLAHISTCLYYANLVLILPVKKEFTMFFVHRYLIIWVDLFKIDNEDQTWQVKYLLLYYTNPCVNPFPAEKRVYPGFVRRYLFIFT